MPATNAPNAAATTYQISTVAFVTPRSVLVLRAGMPAAKSLDVDAIVTAVVGAVATVGGVTSLVGVTGGGASNPDDGAVSGIVSDVKDDSPDEPVDSVDTE